MIAKEDLLKVKLDEEKANQVMELLGESAKVLYAKDEYAKAMGDVDRSILMAYGIPKNPNETTSAYQKRAATTKMNEIITAKETEHASTIDDLNKKLLAKPGDEKLVKELQDAKAELAKIPDLIDEKVNEWKSKYEEVEREFNSFKTQSELKSFLPKFKDDVDPEFRDFKVKSAIDKILASKELQKTDDGKLLIYDPVNHERTPADSYLSKELEAIAFKAVIQNGGGAGGDNGNPGGSGKGTLKFAEGLTNIEKYNSIKEHIGTQEGIDKFAPNYSKRLNELCKDHDLTDYVIPELQEK